MDQVTQELKRILEKDKKDFLESVVYGNLSEAEIRKISGAVALIDTILDNSILTITEVNND